MSTTQEALEQATRIGSQSPCVKSKRGVVLFWEHPKIMVSGFNGPPPGFSCQETEACRASCGKVSIHAEQAVLLECIRLGIKVEGAEMLHVKVVEGEPVPSTGPSCVDCSKLILPRSPNPQGRCAGVHRPCQTSTAPWENTLMMFLSPAMILGTRNRPARTVPSQRAHDFFLSYDFELRRVIS